MLAGVNILSNRVRRCLSQSLRDHPRVTRPRAKTPPVLQSPQSRKRESYVANLPFANDHIEEVLYWYLSVKFIFNQLQDLDLDDATNSATVFFLVKIMDLEQSQCTYLGIKLERQQLQVLDR
jgi:hypothetical protein